SPHLHHTTVPHSFPTRRSSDLDSSEISESVNFCVMEAIKLCRLDTPIIFIEARINLSRFVVTGCAAKTSATVTFPSLNLISLFAFCFKDRKSGSAGMPRPISYAVFCLKKKNHRHAIQIRALAHIEVFTFIAE